MDLACVHVCKLKTIYDMYVCKLNYLPFHLLYNAVALSKRTALVTSGLHFLFYHFSPSSLIT